MGVTTKETRAANATLRNSKTSMTAVFAGATAGIGLATLRAFAAHIPEPRAVIVGRNPAKFAPELEKLKQINQDGTFTFVEAQVSLIKSIDEACREIQSKLNGEKIDLLFMSPGVLSFNGRVDTTEGIDQSMATRHYGRIRFVNNLLPAMAPNARVLSVLGGGQEAKVNENDLELKHKGNFGLVAANNHTGTMQTLSYDYLSEHNPQKAFIHAFPGLVSTDLLSNSATGVLGVFFRWFMIPVFKLLFASPEESGERMLYYATSEQFAQGAWPIDERGDVSKAEALKEYRAQRFQETVWEHNEKVFEKALSA